MPRFELHPQAAQALDTKADALLAKVGSLPRPPERRRFASQRIPAAIITTEDIAGRIVGQSVDEYKKEVTAVQFEGNDGMVGFEGEAVRELDKLAQLSLKYLRAERMVSESFVRGLVIDWLQERFRGEIDILFSSMLVTKVNAAIATRTVLIPIANLSLEEDLPFGPVDFKVIAAEIVDAWRATYRAMYERQGQDLTSFEADFDRLRKKTQGLAAVALTVEAEGDYACEMCLEKAEQAVALLRILHPANTLRTQHSMCGLSAARTWRVMSPTSTRMAPSRAEEPMPAGPSRASLKFPERSMTRGFWSFFALSSRARTGRTFSRGSSTRSSSTPRAILPKTQRRSSSSAW